MTFQTPLLAPGAYVANLICTGSLTNVPTTPVNVIAGAAPQAAVSVTSPAHAGGAATLTARGCGRSANGEVQAAVQVLGASSSFSFYGSTRSDGTVVQGFGIPATAAKGTYTVQVNCGRNPSQIAIDPPAGRLTLRRRRSSDAQASSVVGRSQASSGRSFSPSLKAW